MLFVFSLFCEEFHSSSVESEYLFTGTCTPTCIYIKACDVVAGVCDKHVLIKETTFSVNKHRLVCLAYLVRVAMVQMHSLC